MICTFIKHMKYNKAELVEVEVEVEVVVEVEVEDNTEADDFQKGVSLLQLCSQGNGAGDVPTSVIVEFLRFVN